MKNLIFIIISFTLIVINLIVINYKEVKSDLIYNNYSKIAIAQTTGCTEKPSETARNDRKEKAGTYQCSTCIDEISVTVCIVEYGSVCYPSSITEDC